MRLTQVLLLTGLRDATRCSPMSATCEFSSGMSVGLSYAKAAVQTVR